MRFVIYWIADRGLDNVLYRDSRRGWDYDTIGIWKYERVYVSTDRFTLDRDHADRFKNTKCCSMIDVFLPR